MITNDNFTTTDYGLANWLVFNRIQLLGTVHYANDSKKSFVFLYSDRIPELEAQWGPPLSNPETEPAKTCKKFFSAHSIIKKALKDSIDV